MGRHLAIVQDDASFLALVDPFEPSDVRAIPYGSGVIRTFDEARGNKAHKLDLEACLSLPERDLFLGFGSGSTARRESVLVARALGPSPQLRVVHAPQLYAMLRANVGFAGSELNVEGVACVGDRVRMFNRGNGAPRGEIQPIDASLDFSLDALLAHLLDGAPLPQPSEPVRYDLGQVDGVRLGFTDAVAVGERVFYLAAAEASPDAYRDGPVAGVVVGVIDGERVRCARVLANGAPFDGKAEGVVFDPSDPRRGFLVIDRDAPDAPAELLRLELSGPW